MSEDNLQTEEVTTESQTEEVGGENAGEEIKATGTETTDTPGTETEPVEKQEVEEPGENAEDLLTLQQKRDRDRSKPWKKGEPTRAESFLERKWGEAVNNDGSINFETVLNLSEDSKLVTGIGVFAKKHGYRNVDALMDAAEKDLLGSTPEPTVMHDPRVDKLLYEKEQEDYQKWETSALESINMEKSSFDARFVSFKANRDALVIKGHSLKEAGVLAFREIEIVVLKEGLDDPKRKVGREALSLPDKSGVATGGKISSLMPRDEYLKMSEADRIEYHKTHRMDDIVQFA